MLPRPTSSCGGGKGDHCDMHDVVEEGMVETKMSRMSMSDTVEKQDYKAVGEVTQGGEERGQKEDDQDVQG